MVKKEKMSRLAKVLAVVITGGLLYSVGSVIPGIASLPIYNSPRKTLKEMYRWNYPERAIFIKELEGREHLNEVKDGELAGTIEGELMNERDGGQFFTYSEPLKVIWRKKILQPRDPFLDGITDEEFFEMIDDYEGPVDCWQFNRYLKKKKQELINKRN